MAAINELYRRTRGVIVQEDGWRFRRNLNKDRRVEIDGQLTLGLPLDWGGRYTMTDMAKDFEIKIFEKSAHKS